jgi:hypothetical protein
MGKTILELFKGSTQDKSVKADKETFIEQETSGNRIRSAVELNNPLIYGNEAIRIVNRTTSTLDTMKSATSGEAGDGGLIGKGLSKLTGGKVSSVSQARDAVNSKLGIPSTPNPSRLMEDIVKINSSEPITKDNVGEGLQGTGLGNFLKDTGGGNPKTLGKQALGKGIGLAKDKLRGALFGEGQSIGDVVGDDNGVRLTYNNENTYTTYNQEERNIFAEGGVIDDPSAPAIPFGNQSNTRVDLKRVSPIYGVGKGRYGNTANAYVYNPDNPRKNEKLPKYAPGNPFVGTTPNGGGIIPLEKNYGIGTGGSSKNLDRVSPSDEYTLDDNKEFIKIGEDIYRDFVPVWFKKKGTQKPIVFRAVLSGITENTSPSWSSNKFVGNPYSFYMYDGVERSVSFNIKLFATSPSVLSSMWERLKLLTAYSYPTIAGGLTTPPIIEFRLGSIYVGKTGFIETLTYTIPDESNWETNGELGYLPKTIDVSLTVKFIEQQGSEDRLYDFTISKEAAKAINDKRETTGVSGDPQTGEEQKPPKMTTKGESELKVKVKKVKTTNPLAPKGFSLPAGFKPTEINPKESQSSVVDKTGGKTPIENTKEIEQKKGISNQQAYQLENFNLTGPKAEVKSKSSVPEFIKGEVSNNPKSIIAYQKGFSTVTNGDLETWWEIDVNGNVTYLGERGVTQIRTSRVLEGSEKAEAQKRLSQKRQDINNRLRG